MTADVSRRIALVTGAAHRIGEHLARHLAAQGCAVVLHGSVRSRDRLQALVAELQATGARADLVVCDLADPDAAGELVLQAREPFGALDLLVNNASVFVSDDIATFEAATFDHVMAVNLRAPLLLARDFAAQAQADADPVIVNVLDQRVLAPNPLFLSYTLAKSGLATATTVLAQALAPTIRVNAVAPGPVLPNAHDGPERFQAEVAQVPLRRSVPLAAVAEAIDYLVAARSVTGQIIAVDSGQHLAWRTPDVLASLGEES